MEQYKKKNLEKEEFLMVLKRQWMQKIHFFENEILEDESFETIESFETNRKFRNFCLHRKKAKLAKKPKRNKRKIC